MVSSLYCGGPALARTGERSSSLPGMKRGRGSVSQHVSALAVVPVQLDYSYAETDIDIRGVVCYHPSTACRQHLPGCGLQWLPLKADCGRAKKEVVPGESVLLSCRTVASVSIALSARALWGSIKKKGDMS